MNKQELSIVIPCKNEKKLIIKTLDYIQSQKIDCKIIISDSSDDIITSIYINEYIKNSPLDIIITDGGLPSIARNKGAKLVETPYILFLDADMFLINTNILNDCLKLIKSKDYHLITCHIKSETGKYNWIYTIFSSAQILLSLFYPVAVGGFMLFKTEEFKKLNGFNEEDKIAEDYHLSSKIKSKKFKIANYKIYTTDRRFEKKGIWYMIKLAWSSFINRNNPEFFKQDYNYWI